MNLIQEGVPATLAGATSRSLAGKRWLSELLGMEIVRASYLRKLHDCHAFIGWGNKASGLRALRLARRHHRTALLIEDGFLRSCGDSKDSAAFSICVDEKGIYYDATRESDLELLVRQPLTAAEIIRANALINFWRQARVSKYNHIRANPAAAPDSEYILVVDQTSGDHSIAGAGGNAGSFELMLTAAIEDNPGARIIVKTHPDVVAGYKRGYLTHFAHREAAHVELLSTPVHVPDLLERAKIVYTVSSQVGFEALLWGVPVKTFGMPFYAGWGLTKDALPAPDRRQAVPLTSLVHAALIRYARYVDPETGTRCEVERIIEHVALQRRMRARFPARIHAVGFSRWKRPIVKSYFSGSTLTFARGAQKPPSETEALVVWGCKFRAPLKGQLPVIHVEDGFLRSAGLGAALTFPLSWVQDRVGIYYDATHESELERLLNAADYPRKTLDRAAKLRERIVERDISKYNLTDPIQWQRPASALHVILIAGQVESDASLEYGATRVGCIDTNRQLIESVRAMHPNSYLLYRAHPDVSHGYRASENIDRVIEQLVDERVDHVMLRDLFKGVDEIHVITSLIGFEGLLRGIPVTAHGFPFYAGRGLTKDICYGRRSRKALDINTLVAGTLIDYPAYICPVSGQFTTPERVLSILESVCNQPRASLKSKYPLYVKAVRLAVRIVDRIRALTTPGRPC